MQQIKTHANTTVQKDNNSVRDTLQWRTSSAVCTHQQAAETPVHLVICSATDNEPDLGSAHTWSC